MTTGYPMFVLRWDEEICCPSGHLGRLEGRVRIRHFIFVGDGARQPSAASVQCASQAKHRKDSLDYFLFSFKE